MNDHYVCEICAIEGCIACHLDSDNEPICEDCGDGKILNNNICSCIQENAIIENGVCVCQRGSRLNGDECTPCALSNCDACISDTNGNEVCYICTNGTNLRNGECLECFIPGCQ